MDKGLIARRTTDLTKFACCVLISTVATIIIATLHEGSSPTEQIEVKLGTLFPIFALIIAPLWETLVFQTLPSFLGDTFSWSSRTVWVSTILPFTLSHVDPQYYALTLANGLIGGTVLAYAYIFYKRYSHIAAFLTTILLHIVHNAIFLFMEF